MKQQNWRHSLIITLLILASPYTLALSDMDRKYCDQLHHALISLRPIIESAKTDSQSRERISINWEKVENDLNKLIDGLNKAVTLPRREPRVLAPSDVSTEVQGNYIK